MLELMSRGSQNRSIAATNMNEKSSRSHSLFLLKVNQKDLNTEETKSGKLFCVDLAGSEKIRKTNA
jgi:kinesin family protein 5